MATPIKTSLETTHKIVVTTAVLHNVAIANNLPMEDLPQQVAEGVLGYQEDLQTAQQDPQAVRQGKRRRDEVVEICLNIYRFCSNVQDVTDYLKYTLYSSTF